MVMTSDSLLDLLVKKAGFWNCYTTYYTTHICRRTYGFFYFNENMKAKTNGAHTPTPYSRGGGAVRSTANFLANNAPRKSIFHYGVKIDRATTV